MDSTTFHLGDLVNSLISITSSKIEEINSKIDQEDPDSLKKSISERWMRMLVLLRWSEQFHEVESWKTLQENIDLKEKAWNSSLEKLYQTDDIVKQAKEVVFDLPTAIDVFTTGTYNRLPEVIQFEESTDKYSKYIPKVLERLTDFIKMTLLKEKIPKELKVVFIENGQVLMRANHEFEVLLTISHQEFQQIFTTDGQIKEEKNPRYLWRILKLNFLVNEEGIAVSEMNRQKRLIQVLQARINGNLSPYPLEDLYNKLPYDVLEKQSKVLVNGIYKNIIQIKYEKNLMIIDYWKGLYQLGDVLSEYGGSIKIGIMNNNLLIQHENPNHVLENVNLSELNLSNIIMYFIQQNIIYRLNSLKISLESSYEGKIDIHQDLINNNSYLMINLFESYDAIITLNWKTGKLLFEYKNGNEEFTCKKSQELENINKTLEVLYNMKRQIIYECYENSSKLLNLDTYIAKDDQDNDCLFIKYPEFKNVFILVSTNGFIPIFRVVLYDKFITEVNEVKFTYQKYSNHDLNSLKNLEYILKNSKRAILRFSLFQEISRFGITLKKSQNGGSFYVECKNLKPNHFEIVISDKNWAVYLYENQPSFIRSGKYIGYINYTNSLCFNYETESFDIFLNDLKCVDKMTRLAMDCERLKIPTSCLNHSKITLNYGNNYSCDIICIRGKFMIILNPSNEMIYLLQEYLQKTESIELFYKKLENISGSLLEFKKYNWNIIVRDLDEIRLFYNKNSFVVNFLEGDLTIKGPSKVYEKKDKDLSSFVHSFYQMISVQSILEVFQNVLKKYGNNFQKTEKEIYLKFDNEYILRANEQNRALEVKCKNLMQLENAFLEEIVKDVNDEAKMISLIHLLKIPFDLLKIIVTICSKSRNQTRILFSIPQDIKFSDSIIYNLKEGALLPGTPSIKYENGEINFIIRIINDKRQYIDVPISYKLNETKLEFRLWQDVLKVKGNYAFGKTSVKMFSRIKPGDYLKVAISSLKEMDIQEFKDL